MKLRKLIFLLTLSSITLLSTMNVSAAWQRNDKGWWYDEGNGNYKANTLSNLGGKFYLFSGDGYMLTGWQKYSGSWYYFNPDGSMFTGWLSVGGKWYHLKPDGQMSIGWLHDGIYDYYLYDDGSMATQKFKISGGYEDSENLFYADNDGRLKTNYEFSEKGIDYKTDAKGRLKYRSKRTIEAAKKSGDSSKEWQAAITGEALTDKINEDKEFIIKNLKKEMRDDYKNNVKKLGGAEKAKGIEEWKAWAKNDLKEYLSLDEIEEFIKEVVK